MTVNCRPEGGRAQGQYRLHCCVVLKKGFRINISLGHTFFVQGAIVCSFSRAFRPLFGQFGGFLRFQHFCLQVKNTFVISIARLQAVPVE